MALLDMQMPEMDGIALAQEITKDPSISKTKLVLMPSISFHDDDMVRNAGISATLPKPARQSDLFDTIAHVLGRSGAFPAEHKTASRPRIGADKARILLAEDNPVNQMVASGILETLGFRVDSVADGKEALDALEKLPYDLVLMDVQMPRMDGFETTKMVRDPSTPVRNHAVPIIAMTANAMQGDRTRCLAAGMNDYVSKPVSPEELADALERWLPMTESHADAGMDSSFPPGSESVAFDRAGLLARVMGNESLAKKVMLSFLEMMPPADPRTANLRGRRKSPRNRRGRPRHQGRGRQYERHGAFRSRRERSKPRCRETTWRRSEMRQIPSKRSSSDGRRRRWTISEAVDQAGADEMPVSRR